MTAPGRQRVAIIGSLARSLINFRGPLIAEMTARGHEVHALAPEIDGDTANRLRAIGAIPISVNLSATSLNPYAGLQTIRQLTRTLLEIQADVVVAYTIKPVVLGAAAARAAGVARFVPFVTGLGYAFTGGSEPKRLISRGLAMILYRRAFARSTVALFQNPDDVLEFRRLGLLPSRLPVAIVNGSGVDIGHFESSPLPPDPSFLMVARLLGDKGVREYAAAACRLKQLQPRVRITLAGGVDSSPDAIGKAELGRIMAAGVDYIGRLEDVRPAMKAHSVYVLPSYREGTPRSVLEALAMARAIITTDAPGCRETVMPGRNGLLVPPRDATSLFEAMKRFVDEPGLAARMGPISRALAEEKYDVRLVNADILRHVGL